MGKIQALQIVALSTGAVPKSVPVYRKIKYKGEQGDGLVRTPGYLSPENATMWASSPTQKRELQSLIATANLSRASIMTLVGQARFMRSKPAPSGPKT